MSIETRRLPPYCVGSIGPTLERLFVHSVSVEISTLVGIRVNVAVVVRTTSHVNGLTEQLTTMAATGSRAQFF